MTLCLTLLICNIFSCLLQYPTLQSESLFSQCAIFLICHPPSRILYTKHFPLPPCHLFDQPALKFYHSSWLLDALFTFDNQLMRYITDLSLNSLSYQCLDTGGCIKFLQGRGPQGLFAWDLVRKVIPISGKQQDFNIENQLQRCGRSQNIEQWATQKQAKAGSLHHPWAIGIKRRNGIARAQRLATFKGAEVVGGWARGGIQQQKNAVPTRSSAKSQSQTYLRLSFPQVQALVRALFAIKQSQQEARWKKSSLGNTVCRAQSLVIWGGVKDGAVKHFEHKQSSRQQRNGHQGCDTIYRTSQPKYSAMAVRQHTQAPWKEK